MQLLYLNKLPNIIASMEKNEIKNLILKFGPRPH